MDDDSVWAGTVDLLVVSIIMTKTIYIYENNFTTFSFILCGLFTVSGNIFIKWLQDEPVRSVMLLQYQQRSTSILLLIFAALGETINRYLSPDLHFVKWVILIVFSFALIASALKEAFRKKKVAMFLLGQGELIFIHSIGIALTELLLKLLK